MDELAPRFQWADVTLRTIEQCLGHARMQKSLLCSSAGSDSDFSGGAAAWECAAAMLESAAGRRALDMDLTSRTACVLWLHLTMLRLVNARKKVDRKRFA